MKPIYPPEHLRGMLDKLGEVNALKIGTGTHPGLAAMAQTFPVDEHHCVNCNEKRPYSVEGEEVMDNGALRRYGTCRSCGTRVSKFVAGSRPKTKAS